MDALTGMFAALPSAEAAQAAARANGCEASASDPPTVCTAPDDGLVASGCAVASGEGTCTPIPHSCATLPSACPFTVLQTAMDDKANQADVTALQDALSQKVDGVVVTALQNSIEQKADNTVVENLAALIGASDPEPEVTPCRCAPCADLPIGGEMCVPWGAAEPCDCVDTSGSTDPVRVAFGTNTGDQVCDRLEWVSTKTLAQTPGSSPEVFPEDDIQIRIRGQVTFSWLGWGLIEQVGDFATFEAVSDGIRSGDTPAQDGSFTHTFDTAGEYYFASPVHDSL
ncbi:MAG: hypothetical protein VX747_07315, partial [Actinomycetota bacterium]|nr:hypothetical protein [Actinomycetota bacterium]